MRLSVSKVRKSLRSVPSADTLSCCTADRVRKVLLALSDAITPRRDDPIS